MSSVFAPLTSIGSLWSDYNAFVAGGSVLARAQDTGNVVNPPLLTGPSSTLLRDIVFIPECHVLTGVVGKLVMEMERCRAFRSKEVGADFMYTWMKSEDIFRSFHNGTPSFRGNMGRKLLLRCSSLVEALKEKLGEKAAIALPFVCTLQFFNLVVDRCFGQYVQPSYEEAIHDFMKCYRSLGISVTLKVFCTHCVSPTMQGLIYVVTLGGTLREEKYRKLQNNSYPPNLSTFNKEQLIMFRNF